MSSVTEVAAPPRCHSEWSITSSTWPRLQCRWRHSSWGVAGTRRESNLPRRPSIRDTSSRGSGAGEHVLRDSNPSLFETGYLLVPLDERHLHASDDVRAEVVEEGENHVDDRRQEHEPTAYVGGPSQHISHRDLEIGQILDLHPVANLFDGLEHTRGLDEREQHRDTDQPHDEEDRVVEERQLQDRPRVHAFDRSLDPTNCAASGSRARRSGSASCSPRFPAPLFGGPGRRPQRPRAWWWGALWRPGGAWDSRSFQGVRLPGSFTRKGLIEHLEGPLRLARVGGLAWLWCGLGHGGRPLRALRAQLAQATARGGQAPIIALGVAQRLKERLVLVGNPRRVGARVRLSPRSLFLSVLSRSHASPFSHRRSGPSMGYFSVICPF